MLERQRTNTKLQGKNGQYENLWKHRMWQALHEKQDNYSRYVCEWFYDIGKRNRIVKYL